MDDIFRITKDTARAIDLIEMAKERREILKILPHDKTYKIVEDYYEIVKELLTALMYIDGYKTLSHVKFIEYFAAHYRDLDDQQLRLLDTLRKHRHGIVYYGKKIGQEFLLNHEKEIKTVLTILFSVTERKVKQ